jgi:hypothetical protein
MDAPVVVDVVVDVNGDGDVSGKAGVNMATMRATSCSEWCVLRIIEVHAVHFVFRGRRSPFRSVAARPPRGWAGPDRSSSPSVMLVSLNPGHPLRLPEKYGTGWNELALLRRHELVADASSEGGVVVARRRTAVTRAAAKDVADICWRSYSSSTAARGHLFHRRSVPR